ncbi:MAG TPA: FHA domain-containing protein [Polyangiaceae bacterium]|nr:FHA domain-containing protein [Polyangiaceae bacterium]
MANEKPSLADDEPNRPETGGPRVAPREQHASGTQRSQSLHHTPSEPEAADLLPRDVNAFDGEVTVVREHSLVTACGRGAVSARLELMRGPGAPRVIPLAAVETVIGRSNQASVCLESHLLSRRHIALVPQGPGYRLQDLESANGVYLNGVKVHSAVLHEGDVIQIGDVLLVFHEGSA